jgi:PAS domain S-box-containing protein
MNNSEITESKAAAMAMGRLAAIVESSDDAIISQDLNGIITSWNKGAERIFGYTAGEMVETSMVRLIPPERQEEETDILGKIKRGEKVEHFETWCRTKDGRQINLSVTASPIKDAAGHIIGLSKIARDITQRKQAETLLFASEQPLQAFFTSAPAGLALLDRQLRYVQLNETVAEINGVSMHDHLGKTVREILPNLAPVAEPLLQKVLATGQPVWNVELSGETRSQPGVLRHWLETFFPIFGKDGRPDCIGVIFVETTAQKQAERKLRESEEKFSRIFESSPMAMALSTLAEGRYLDVNPEFLKILQRTRDEVIGRTALELGVWTNLEERNAQIAKLKERMPLRNVELEIRGKSGQVTQFLWSAEPVVIAGQDCLLGSLLDITERKRVEVALREGERQLATLMSNLPGMAYRCRNDQNWTMEFVSAGAQTLTGYTAAELMGNRAVAYASLIHPDDRAAVWNQVQADLKQGKPFVLIYRLRTATGAERWVWEQGEGIFDAQHQLLAIEGFVTDITESKQAAQALAHERALLRTLLDHLPVAVYLKDTAGRKTLTNPMDLRNCGITSEAEILGRTDYDFFPPEQAAAFQADDQRVLGGQPVLNREEQLTRPDGYTCWLLTSKVPLHDDTGQVTGLAGLGLDITESKRAKEELRWKTAFLEAQVDSSMDGILVVDSRGKKILQNQHLTGLWKIPPAIAENEDDAVQVQFIANATKKPLEFMAKVAHLYAHPDEVSRDEIELVDGMILDRYSSPVRDQSGKYYGRIWTFRDITPQRKLEVQLRQSQKMEAFGQLAGGVAHDFNNILAIIQIQAGLLKSEPSLSLQQLEFAREIERAAERAANLTRQLLLFSRKQTMQPRNLKLKEVVENIAKMLQRTLGEQVQLQFKFAAEPLVIHADPGMIDQILLNLVVNARDAMPRGGKIIIETTAAEFNEVTAAQTVQARPGLFACLSVSDTGGGIPPEILPRIFEPFFTTKEVGKGTGLGLATIFGIVQQHQGWINVQSELGRGTTFRVYLPRQTTAADTEFFWSSPASMPGGRETILLVEDELAVRSSVRIALTRLGYRVLEAADGEEALALWKQHQDEVRLLLTDLVMPGEINGKDLAGQLLQQNPQLKVIYASGYSAEVAGTDLLLEERVNFLSKPFKADELAQTIRNRLDERA